MSCMFTGGAAERPSRGLNDLDSDDEDMDTCQAKKSYEVEVSGKVDDVEVLIVTNTKISRDFVDVYTDASNEVVGAVKETTTSQQEEGQETSVQQTIATLKKLNNQVCRCDFLSEPGTDHLNGVAVKLLGKFVNAKLSVVVLTSKNLTQYQRGGHDIEDTPEVVTKWLKTSKWAAASLKPKDRLEQPNIIGGLPAALLTQAEFGKKSCCLAITYTDVDKSDSLTLRGLRDTFFKLDPVKKLSLVPVADKLSSARLRKLFEQQDNGNIFM